MSEVILAHSLFVSVYFGRASTRPYSYAMSPCGYAMSPAATRCPPEATRCLPAATRCPPPRLRDVPPKLRDNTLYRYLCKQFRGGRVRPHVSNAAACRNAKRAAHHEPPAVYNPKIFFTKKLYSVKGYFNLFTCIVDHLAGGFLVKCHGMGRVNLDYIEFA